MLAEGNAPIVSYTPSSPATKQVAEANQTTEIDCLLNPCCTNDSL